MKKSIFLAAAGAIAVAVTGCTSIITSEGATLGPNPEATHPGYKAVLKHETKRVTGNSQLTILFGFFSWGANGQAENSNLSAFSFVPSHTNAVKSAAVYDACQKNNADTLLGTRYKVTTTDYLLVTTIKCEVAGFPATMTGVTELKPYVLKGNQEDKLVYLDQAPTVIK